MIVLLCIMLDSSTCYEAHVEHYLTRPHPDIREQRLTLRSLRRSLIVAAFRLSTVTLFLLHALHAHSKQVRAWAWPATCVVGASTWGTWASSSSINSSSDLRTPRCRECGLVTKGSARSAEEGRGSRWGEQWRFAWPWECPGKLGDTEYGRPSGERLSA